jgi:hypothetical protein
MKIFEIRFEKEQEKAWVYALTNIDAIKTYCSVSGTDLVEFDKEDFIFEIPKEQWKDYTFYDDESEELDKKTFEQWVSENEIYGSDIVAITAN